MRTYEAVRSVYVFSALALALSCAATASRDESDSGSSDGGDTITSGSGGQNSGQNGDGNLSTTGSGGSLAGLPEEIEDEPSYNAPVATGQYLWSANPESGRVALIDVVDLTVEVMPAGLTPTHLAAIPSSDEVAQAIVLNTGSSDATRFIIKAGELRQETVATHVGANRWSISSSGNWAVAWSAGERNQVLDPTEGLQEITVIHLAENQMKATRLTVGYRPSQVLVAEDDERLIVVSAEGLTLIDLGEEPTQVRWIDLGFEAETRDVSLSQDGGYALVRRSGQSSVDLIDLKSPDDVSTINFSGPVTDLDLARSGRAVAIIRENYQLATFELQEVIADPSEIATTTIEGEIFGSAALTEDGSTVVVYTNATPNDRVTIVDLRAEDFLTTRSIATESPVYSVTTTPDGEHAGILGADQAGRPSDAFSLLSLRSERFPRVIGTGAPVDEIALGNDFGIVTATSTATNTYEAHLVAFPGLSASAIQLSARPLSVGLLPELSAAYVAQEHPEGRITFFDFQANEARTLTGFELSAEVVDE
jgi:hypothetical protein